MNQSYFSRVFGMPVTYRFSDVENIRDFPLKIGNYFENGFKKTDDNSTPFQVIEIPSFILLEQ